MLYDRVRQLGSDRLCPLVGLLAILEVLFDVFGLDVFGFVDSFELLCESDLPREYSKKANDAPHD